MDNPTLIVLVGLPGSGKSTFCGLSAHPELENYVRISQDDQGKTGHKEMFDEAIEQRRNIIVDRCNFNVDQRKRYLAPAKAAGYFTKIVWINVPAEECIARIKRRTDHPNLAKGNEKIEEVVRMFEKMFVAPTKDEADQVVQHFDMRWWG